MLAMASFTCAEILAGRAPKDEPVTGNLENSKLTVGVRYELTDFATLKVEYGQRRKPGTEHVNGVFAQTAFTF